MEKLFLVFFFMLSSCSSLYKDTPFDDTIEESSTTRDHKLQKLVHDLESNRTRLLAQIEELERVQKSQQQYISILEKAVAQPAKTPKKQEQAPAFTIIDNIRNEKKIDKNPKKVSSEKKPVLNDYADELNTAKELFNQKKFSQAFLAFSKIDRNFDQKVSQGETLFWIARCWFEMAEFKSANIFFKNFIERFPNSKHAPIARSYLANIDSLANSASKNE